MQPHSIFITRKIPEAGITMLREKGYDVEVGEKEKPLTQDELIAEVSKKPYDAIVTLLTDHIDAHVFDAMPSVKLIANYTVGYNNIDIEEAKKRGVTVTNTRGTSSSAVAEHAVALMLALTTRLLEGDKLMRDGKYHGWDPDLLMGQDMLGATIGIVGSGAIGSKLAHIMHFGFGCKIVYSDVVKNETLERDCGAIHAELDDVLKQADIISLHVPLMKETTHLINREKLQLMKKTSFIINTSRGPVIDEQALVDALKDGTIAGAGLDVYEHEPMMTEGLAELTNVVLTPHIASARPSARIEMSKLVADNIISFFEKNGEVITPVY